MAQVIALDLCYNFLHLIDLEKIGHAHSKRSMKIVLVNPSKAADNRKKLQKKYETVSILGCENFFIARKTVGGRTISFKFSTNLYNFTKLLYMNTLQINFLFIFIREHQ